MRKLLLVVALLFAWTVTETGERTVFKTDNDTKVAQAQTGQQTNATTTTGTVNNI